MPLDVALAAGIIAITLIVSVALLISRSGKPMPPPSPRAKAVLGIVIWSCVALTALSAVGIIWLSVGRG
jgi:hypothetical protein